MVFNLGELLSPVRAVRASVRLLAGVDHVVTAEICLVVEFLWAQGARVVHAVVPRDTVHYPLKRGNLCGVG